MWLKFKAIIALSLLVFISGCGGTQIRGNFSNETLPGEEITYRLSMPVKINLCKFSLGGEITNPYLIGEAKTGAFNSKTEVISDIPIQDILYNALNDAFKKMGFIIVSDRVSADLIVTGEIQQFWVREFASGWTPEYAKAGVRYDIVLKDNNDKAFWAKSIDTEAKSSSLGAFLDATGSLLPTLKKALSQSIGQITNDFNLKNDLNKLIEQKK